MRDDRDALLATVSAYRAELLDLKAKLDATQTKLSEANAELAKAREEVEDLKRAYGELQAEHYVKPEGWL
jgi:chromosome segregation ATPase